MKRCFCGLLFVCRGVGAGYYVMDNARVDLTFDHFVNPTHTGKRTINGVAYDGKLKGTINTLLLTIRNLIKDVS
jgi:hypothetical protein